MERPKICAVIVNNDLDAVNEIEPLVDLFEVRIDLIGNGWQEVARHLVKPWIACNRTAKEGGRWEESEEKRTEELLSAIELGASIIDIELGTKDLEDAVKKISKKARCLLSFHDLEKTPLLGRMREIVQKQIKAGADICKVVTTAQSLEDNWTVLQVVKEFSETRIVSFAMGPLGYASRILCPMVGGYFTYASIEKGKESAPGQITVKELRKLYDMVKK